MSTPGPTRPVARARGVAFTVSAAVTTFALAALAMAAVVAIGDRYIDERNRACNWPRPPAVPRLPWYELPLGITATVLMVVSAGSAVLAYRRLGAASRWRGPVGLLVSAAVLGTLFAAWFGIHAVLADSSTPPHCGG